jgi:hypothetical protein
MKSRDGSRGNWKTRISARRGSRRRGTVKSAIRVRGTSTMVPTSILLTSRWSPIWRVSSMEPEGILKAWTTKVRMTRARATATRMASVHSRAADFRRASRSSATVVC